MPKLSRVMQQTRKVEVKFGEEVIQVEYYLDAISPEKAKEMDEQHSQERVTFQLSQYIKSWDVTDDEGAVIVPSIENLNKFGTWLLIALLEAITKDISGWSKEEKK